MNQTELIELIKIIYLIKNKIKNSDEITKQFLKHLLFQEEIDDEPIPL
jgi:hypothetical protein